MPNWPSLVEQKNRTQISIDLFSRTTCSHSTKCFALNVHFNPHHFSKFQKITSQYIWIQHHKGNSSSLCCIKFTSKQCCTFSTVLIFPMIAVFSQSSLLNPFFSERISHYNAFIFWKKNNAAMNLNGSSLTNDRQFFFRNPPAAFFFCRSHDFLQVTNNPPPSQQHHLGIKIKGVY